MRLARAALAFLLFLPASVSAADKPITFCRPDNLVALLGYVAEENGYFKEEGIAPVFLTATNAKICQDNLVAGKGDMMFGGEGPFTYLGFRAHPLLLVAQLGTNPETAVFARADAGIAAESDLKGKRIGYLPGTVSALYLARLMEKLKLTADDVKLTAMQPPVMPQALRGGMIDAFVMWEPWGDAALKQLGGKAIRLRDPALYNYASVFSVTAAIAQNDPAAVRAVLRALLKAEIFVKDHPAETMRIAAKAVRFDAAVIEKYWPDYDNRITLNPSLTALLEKNARYIIRDDPNFKDKAVPDFRPFIDPSFLRAVAPDRVGEGM
ncbi:MAG: NrtA/SsuA/CpmA family ABC transporter substrate-binding protein [Alphaproteobacteria bacterium]